MPKKRLARLAGDRRSQKDFFSPVLELFEKHRFNFWPWDAVLWVNGKFYTTYRYTATPPPQPVLSCRTRLYPSTWTSWSSMPELSNVSVRQRMSICSVTSVYRTFSTLLRSPLTFKVPSLRAENDSGGREGLFASMSTTQTARCGWGGSRSEWKLVLCLWWVWVMGKIILWLSKLQLQV